MGENTLVQVRELDAGKRWTWLADCNILLISAALDSAGRAQAVTEWAEELKRDALAQLAGGRQVRAVS